MDRDAFFWQIQEGKLPQPAAARTLGMSILRVDPEAGVLWFFSPAKPGKLVGVGRLEKRGGGICFLSGELSQAGKIVATATATAAIRKL